MKGIRPSDVVRLMLESAAEVGWWYEEWLPRTHMIEALILQSKIQHACNTVSMVVLRTALSTYEYCTRYLA